ncbi:MAG: glycosyltransferase family 4 protein [Phycisphaerae bacterium]|nr:glycosyltransferase family 4 protein [Phycisphaerae bacterium]
MKELVFIRQSTANMGGIQWQILKLAEKLFSRGCFKPVLITSDKQSPFAQAFSSCGFEVFIVPMGKAKILSAAKEVSKILKDRDVAVIQTPLIESFIARAVRRKRTGIRHIFRAEVYPSGTPCWKKRLCHLLDRLTSQWVDCYVANGQYLTDEIVNRSKVNPDKVITVLNGRDPIGPPDEPYGKPEEPLPARIAMIANFMQGKGHDCLLKALAALKRKNLIVKTRLIGGELGIIGSSKQNTISAIKKLAAKLGVLDQIEFYGYTKDVFNALAGIPVVVLPSDSEGVPNCILEAISLRKLVIASNTGGVSEIIEHGNNGLLCKPKDPKGFANLLEYVFTHKAGDFEQMRTAAFEKWQKEFTSEKMVDNIIKIYRKLGVL